MAIKVMMNLVVFSLAVVAVAFVQSSRAETHVVGATLGWTIPPTGSVAYTDWAANQTFTVGDILLFNFTTGAHDVAEVTSKTAYEDCSTANTLTPVTAGPANVTLTTAGEHFYICTFGTHCSSGQKLAITVSATATSSPSPNGTTTASPPPPPSAAQPLAVAAAALPIALVSIVLALLH